MLDIKFIRENVELIREAARKKRLSIDLGRLVELDDRRLNLLVGIEKMRAEQNRVSDEIGRGEDNNPELVGKMQALKKDLRAKEDNLKIIMDDWRKLMIQVPNVPDISVPEGDSEKDNKEIRREGGKPAFPFPAKSHIQLMLDLDLIDLERGIKISGFRGYILKNEAVALSMAIWKLAFDRLVAKGYTPMIVPSLVRGESLVGTGYLPQGQEDLYKTQDAEYLAGTSEVAVTGHLMNEILDINSLPRKFVAFSPCFRREAGAHGRDSKGLIRVHEFYKVEQVVFCAASHEESVKFHEEITTNAEELMQALGLPYRVVINASADLGLGQVKKYDLEVWMPSENTYRETHSSSYYHDFQARRLNIRYRDPEGKLKFVHTLNSTALATPRILAAIVENYQQADGGVLVPNVLRPYLGKDKISPKN